MTFQVVNPESLEKPRGWSHGMLGPEHGRVLFVAGQTGIDGGDSEVAGDEAAEFVRQFARALDRVLAVVRAAGGRPESIGRMTVFVTDMDVYRTTLEPLGSAWRDRMGRHYPAMALIEVSSLVPAAGRVEIEATAVIESTPQPLGLLARYESFRQRFGAGRGRVSRGGRLEREPAAESPLEPVA